MHTILDLAAIDAAPLAAEPFAHILVPHAVPPEALAAVAADLPPLGRRGSFPVDAVRLGPHAGRLMAELQGDGFRHVIASKFGIDLDGAPVMATLRGRTDLRDGHIHTDSLAKRVTILLYLNRAEDGFAKQQGHLRLLRGPSDLDDYAVEVPPVDGTLLAFPNGPNTWHGHKTFVGRRYAVQLNYMTTDGRARSELRRHRVSALVKRLLPAA